MSVCVFLVFMRRDVSAFVLSFRYQSSSNLILLYSFLCVFLYV